MAQSERIKPLAGCCDAFFLRRRRSAWRRRLLGKLLVPPTRAATLAGRIVEVEAYLGPHQQTPDPAAHSHRGPTPRNSGALRTRGARVCLFHLWPVLLHECLLRDARAMAEAC